MQSPKFRFGALALSVFTAAALAASRSPAQDSDVAWHYERITPKSGSPIDCAVLEPSDRPHGNPTPVLLGLPPGAQDRSMVEVCMKHYWGASSRDLGWVVVCPIAPAGERFDADEDASNLAAVCRWIRTRFTVEGNGIHLAGVSNGGRAAFRVATQMSWQFASLTALPGFPPNETDWRRLPRLARIPVRMFVGGDDRDWLDRAERTRDTLVGLGGDATLRTFEGEGHVPRSLNENLLLETLEAMRSNLDPERPGAIVDDLLDSFHDAAAKADAERYFALFEDDNSIFLGTDATERWTVPEFREWSKSAFAEERDSAWIFVPIQRHVRFSTDSGGTAWFDERLGNAAFGECRGSGVVVRRADGSWRIAQYNLTIPIPNDLAYDFVARIRDYEERRLDPDEDEGQDADDNK